MVTVDCWEEDPWMSRAWVDQVEGPFSGVVSKDPSAVQMPPKSICCANV